MKWLIRFYMVYIMFLGLLVFLHRHGSTITNIPDWLLWLGTGALIFYFYLFYHCIKTSFSSSWLRPIWFFILLFGSPYYLGQLAYFICVYELQIGVKKDMVLDI